MSSPDNSCDQDCLDSDSSCSVDNICEWSDDGYAPQCDLQSDIASDCVTDALSEVACPAEDAAVSLNARRSNLRSNNAKKKKKRSVKFSSKPLPLSKEACPKCGAKRQLMRLRPGFLTEVWGDAIGRVCKCEAIEIDGQLWADPEKCTCIKYSADPFTLEYPDGKAELWGDGDMCRYPERESDHVLVKPSEDFSRQSHAKAIWSALRMRRSVVQGPTLT